MLDFEQKLRGRKVLVTGHTGFTGGWACVWLRALGAEVSGYALAPETEPALYNLLGIESDMQSCIGDIRDTEKLNAFVRSIGPDAVLHLAAQPLVRRSYRAPLETFAVNALGTAHVLEAARMAGTCRAVVCVTTDKVYQNNEDGHAHRETDPLGGCDPYSASKAAAEIIIDGYRNSFGKAGNMAIASARGGNIIGGGDWSEDRLVPDYVRAQQAKKKLVLRYPGAVRPWQHVLGLVYGYLLLLAGLPEAPQQYACAWNFGPLDDARLTVRDVLAVLAEEWTPAALDFMQEPLHEAGLLALDSTRARDLLGWVPPWDTRRAIAETAAWYRGYYERPAHARDLTETQLRQWREALAAIQGKDRACAS
ncbi:MAG: CDP-glucose 4,6-dehydratase [Alphaproteobacteria bacterium]|nr:CDP-glucose 4,6-dehydratase [Alphaproteobacteria bacterium]